MPVGDPDSPTFMVDNTDDVAGIVKRYGDVLRRQHPGLKAKVDGGMTRFILPDQSWCAVTATPETLGDVFYATVVDDRAPRVVDCHGSPVLLFTMQEENSELAVRVGDGIVDFVDMANAKDDAVLDKLMAKTDGATEHGVVRFQDLLVAQAIFRSPTDYKGVDDDDDVVATWSAARGKKPVAVLKPKDKYATPTAILAVTPGSYRVLSGSKGQTRWVRFIPA
jgi:hypothetical protein